MNREVSIVDLFCGAGGLTRGLGDAGLSVEVGIDVDPDCRYPYETNNDADFVERDLADVADEDSSIVGELFDPTADVQVLAGCPPCQPFSSLTHGDDSEEHQMAGLVDVFGSIVSDVAPDIVVMENVYEVREADGYERLLDTLADEGYNVNPVSDRRVYCPEWGIPQTRRRWVTLASRRGSLDLGEPYSEDDDPETVREAIGDLPELQEGDVDEDDPLHRARKLSETNVRRIHHSEPGGTWGDWPERLVLECHGKESGRSYSSVYGRMDPDEPAPTITTQFYNLGSGRFGHYDEYQHRALTLREGAVLQTFPRDYQFVPEGGDVRFNKIGRWIGNAVPPRLGRRIGERIQSFLDRSDRQEALTDY